MIRTMCVLTTRFLECSETVPLQVEARGRFCPEFTLT